MCNNSKEKNDEKYGSLRNLLKTFDPYAVLEPLTPQGMSKENILVDLTNSSQSDLELSGSLLEKSTKSDFEVIDVFQNLFVTPQHVKSKNIKSIDKTKDNKDWIKAFDGIDHKNNDEIDTKKELESIFTVNTFNATITRLSDDEFDVDEIEEVLTMKRLEKVMRSSQYVGSFNIESEINHITEETTETQIADNIKTNVRGNENTKIDELVNIRKSINDYIIDKSKEVTAMKFNNAQIIKTIKLDKKKLQKKIVLEEHEKRNYTKGPDLVEKSIALPSMIERIKLRQEIINNVKCLRHRLVLEPDNLSFIKSNSTVTNEGTSYKFEPEVLTEDCNKQRLTALQAGQAFEKFVTG